MSYPVYRNEVEPEILEKAAQACDARAALHLEEEKRARLRGWAIETRNAAMAAREARVCAAAIRLLVGR